MKKRNIIFALLTMSMLGGCGQQAVSQTQTVSDPARNSKVEVPADAGTIAPPTGEAADNAVSVMSDLSLRLLDNTIKLNGAQENVLISPTSIELALGMTQNGAAGDTLAQMENVLNNGNSIDKMNPAFFDLTGRLEASSDVSWNIANSIWYKSNGSSTPKTDFVQKVNDWYNADIYAAPFDDSTVGEINGWVSNETSGMIPQIIDTISSDANMYLINAVSFEGKWDTEYDENHILEDQTFTNADGSTSTVAMLSSEEDTYFTLGEGEGFMRPYAGGEYSFFAILPNEGVSTADYIADLNNNGTDLSAALSNSSSTAVTVFIPEFTADFKTELKENFIDMGMTLPFGGEADFSNMVDESVYIERILHNTHIELDREGTRAAAVTAVQVETLSIDMPVVPVHTITLDHPFVYGIVDNETGLPIFIGCMNEIK